MQDELIPTISVLEPATASLIVVRAIHIGSVMLAFCPFVFPLFIGGPALRHAGQEGQTRLEQLERWTLRCTQWSAVAGVVSGLAWLALVAAQMSGTPIDQALSRTAFTTVLADTHFGQVSQFRL